MAPANTPRPVVEKLNQALNYALASQDVRTAFDRLGVTPSPTTPDEFAKQIKDEIALWKDTTERMNFQKIKQ